MIAKIKKEVKTKYMPKYSPQHPQIQNKRFVAEFVKTGNGALAARKAYPNIKPASAYGTANRKLKMKDIQQQITDALKAEEVNPALIVKARKRIIDKGMIDLKDVRVTPADMNKTLDSLEKLLGISERGKAQISHLFMYNLPTSEVETHYKSQRTFFDTLRNEAKTVTPEVITPKPKKV